MGKGGKNKSNKGNNKSNKKKSNKKAISEKKSESELNLESKTPTTNQSLSEAEPELDLDDEIEGKDSTEDLKKNIEAEVMKENTQKAASGDGADSSENDSFEIVDEHESPEIATNNTTSETKVKLETQETEHKEDSKQESLPTVQNESKFTDDTMQLFEHDESVKPVVRFKQEVVEIENNENNTDLNLSDEIEQAVGTNTFKFNEENESQLESQTEAEIESEQPPTNLEKNTAILTTADDTDSKTKTKVEIDIGLSVSPTYDHLDDLNESDSEADIDKEVQSVPQPDAKENAGESNIKLKSENDALITSQPIDEIEDQAAADVSELKPEKLSIEPVNKAEVTNSNDTGDLKKEAAVEFDTENQTEANLGDLEESEVSNKFDQTNPNSKQAAEEANVLDRTQIEAKFSQPSGPAATSNIKFQQLQSDTNSVEVTEISNPSTKDKMEAETGLKSNINELSDSQALQDLETFDQAEAESNLNEDNESLDRLSLQAQIDEPVHTLEVESLDFTKESSAEDQAELELRDPAVELSDLQISQAYDRSHLLEPSAGNSSTNEPKIVNTGSKSASETEVVAETCKLTEASTPSNDDQVQVQEELKSKPENTDTAATEFKLDSEGQPISQPLSKDFSADKVTADSNVQRFKDKVEAKGPKTDNSEFEAVTEAIGSNAGFEPSTTDPTKKSTMGDEADPEEKDSTVDLSASQTSQPFDLLKEKDTKPQAAELADAKSCADVENVDTTDDAESHQHALKSEILSSGITEEVEALPTASQPPKIGDTRSVLSLTNPQVAKDVSNSTTSDWPKVSTESRTKSDTSVSTGKDSVETSRPICTEFPSTNLELPQDKSDTEIQPIDLTTKPRISSTFESTAEPKMNLTPATTQFPLGSSSKKGDAKLVDSGNQLKDSPTSCLTSNVELPIDQDTTKLKSSDQNSQPTLTLTELQFQPLKSNFKMELLHELNRLKLDVLKLEVGPAPFLGIQTYMTSREAKDPMMDFDMRSIKINPIQLQSGYNIFTPGSITLYNTLDEFRNLDESEIEQQAQAKLVKNMETGAVLNQPALLRSFQMHMFIDMKKFKYFYRLLQPTFSFKENIQVVNDLGREFSAKQLNSIAKECAALNKINYENKSLEDNCNGYYLMKVLKNSEDQFEFEVKTLNEFDTFYTPADLESKIHFISLDTSTDVTKFNPTSQNLLYYLRKYKDVADVQLLVLRHSAAIKTKGYYHLSRTFQLHLPKPEATFGGWERFDGLDNIKLLDFSSSMDPKEQAKTSVNLNLSLMKWNAEPNLDLETVAKTKCLLLGAGTLGSNVARILMGWNVNQITFVDNGKVSFSNPVRQPLYEFQDCLQGGKPKAEAAAEALKRIYPYCNSNGVNLTIPMPGHRLEPSEVKQVEKDTRMLEQLVQEHDVIFALTDSRESRWLPTVLAKLHGKLMLSVGLGFDGFTVLRHGTVDPTLGVSRLGCYFCSDYQVPTTPLADRTLDQQCTVTRPGLASIASGLAVELMVSILQHPLRGLAPPDPPIPTDLHPYPQPSAVGDLPVPELNRLAVSVPHQLRGFLGQFTTPKLTGQAFPNCVACSTFVTEEFSRRGFQFLAEVLADSDVLKSVAQIDKLEAFYEKEMELEGDDFEIYSSGEDLEESEDPDNLDSLDDAAAVEGLGENLPKDVDVNRIEGMGIEPSLVGEVNQIPTTYEEVDQAPQISSTESQVSNDSTTTPEPDKPVDTDAGEEEGTLSKSWVEVQPYTNPDVDVDVDSTNSLQATLPQLDHQVAKNEVEQSNPISNLGNESADSSDANLLKSELQFALGDAPEYLNLSHLVRRRLPTDDPAVASYAPRLRRRSKAELESPVLAPEAVTVPADGDTWKGSHFLVGNIRRPLANVDWSKVPTKKFLYPVSNDPFHEKSNATDS